MAEHICRDDDYELRMTCRVCGNELREDRDTYGVHVLLTHKLEERGLGVVAVGSAPPDSLCADGEQHDWEGRIIVGISFRKCRRCNKVQRALYKPWFEDFVLALASWEEWPVGPAANREAGTAMGWR